MKRKYYLSLSVLFILISITTQSQTQMPYYDALKLSKWANLNIGNDVSKKERDTIATLLSYYMPKNLIDSTNSFNTIDNFKANNPFFKKIFLHDTSSGKGTEPFSVLSLSSTISSIGNFDVTTVADGLAKFLVQRTKEELSVAFFVQLKEDFNDPNFSDFRILFPQTFSILNLIDIKIYQFSAYLTQLRDAFIIDLDNLPTSASVVINQPKYKDYFSKHPALKNAFQSGLLISSILINKDKLQNIASIINDTSLIKTHFPDNSTFDITINASFKTLQLISESLRTADTRGRSDSLQHYWVSADSLSLLLNDTSTFKIFLGLIYQQAKNRSIVFANNKKLTDILDSASKTIIAVQTSIFSLYSELNAFDNYRIQYTTIKNASQADSAKLSLYYYGIYTNSLEILKDGLSLVNSWNKKPPVPMIDSTIKVMQDVGEIYMYVSQKKYNPAVLSLVKLYSDAINLGNKNSNQLLAKLTTYSSFISQVANAKTSGAVDTIITQTVLPVGSSYIKKHSAFNLALQAYTGLFLGQQQQATDEKPVGAAGVWAPIGIAASWGFTKNGQLPKNPGSFSIFASIIDLGSLVTFRFSDENDTIANNVHVRLAQIVSPGIHIVFGLPKVPISVGAGCNWAPLLTDVEKDQINVSTKNAFRYQIFAAVDIPLLNFHNKPR